METGRRLIQNVECAPRRATRKFLRQLDALRLTARERRRRLPEMDVIEADVAQGFERVPIVALAAAYLAGDVNIGQEMHLDADDAVALARLAAAAFHVERKTPRPVAAHPPFRQLREKLADVREEPRVRRRIRTRRAANGA